MRGAIPAYPVVGLVRAPVFLPRLVYRQAGHFYFYLSRAATKGQFFLRSKRFLKDDFGWMNVQLSGAFSVREGVVLRRVPDAF
ncbi:hypothetical protein [Leclercia adecarboxylata]|uniref:hypothetical protein n=1 Tax=Leclercia adecarboxylata TaxID=83655 RepID=UPI0022E18AC0|nr:hypothetical protein [Leclercia adecarboxylata]WJT04248.1 hypothetical protein OCT50_05535 [Leclercia adecarboxylata]